MVGLIQVNIQYSCACWAWQVEAMPAAHSQSMWKSMMHTTKHGLLVAHSSCVLPSHVMLDCSLPPPQVL
jgi:hypothetical protein